MSFCILLGAPIQISEPARWLVCPPKAAADRLCNGRGGAGRVRARLTWALDAGIFALVVCCELSCLQDRRPQHTGSCCRTRVPPQLHCWRNWTEEDAGCIVGQASSGQSLLLMLQKSAVSEKAIPLFYPVARLGGGLAPAAGQQTKAPQLQEWEIAPGHLQRFPSLLAQAQDAQHVRVQGVVSRSGNGVHGTSRAAQEAQSLSFDALSLHLARWVLSSAPKLLQAAWETEI